MSITADEAIFKQPLLDCLYKTTNLRKMSYNLVDLGRNREKSKNYFYEWIIVLAAKNKQIKIACVKEKWQKFLSETMEVVHLINFRMTSTCMSLYNGVRFTDDKKENLQNVWPQWENEIKEMTEKTNTINHTCMRISK